MYKASNRLCIKMDSKRSNQTETQDNQKQVQAEAGCCSYQDRTSSAEPSCVVALIPARPNRKYKMRVLNKYDDVDVCCLF